MFYTYAHYKPDNSVFYIGKGQRNRAYDKISRSKKWKSLVAEIKDYKVELLGHWKTEQEAFEHEIFLIDCFKNMGAELINVSKGGYGASGYKHTEEFKSARHKSMIGHHNPFYGKTHSLETKEKISLAKRKKPISPWLGKKRSEETKKKISDALMGRQGHKHTEESKKKLSLSHMGKKQAPPSEDTKKKLSEAIKKSWIARRLKVTRKV